MVKPQVPANRIVREGERTCPYCGGGKANHPNRPSFLKRLIAVFRPDYADCSVRGDKLIRDAKRVVVNGQEVLEFGRMLTPEEMTSVREAWQRAYTKGD